MIRRAAALAALVAMLGVPPLVLLGTGSYDWGGVSPWTPTDVRLLLLVLTALGWALWVWWLLSVLVEAVAVLSRGHVRLRVPLLGAGQSLAATLLAAAVATAPLVTPAAVPSAGVAASVTTLTTEAASAQTDAPVAAVPLVARPPRPALDHTVQPGDDLWSLAERYYGEGTGWHAIVEANPHLAGDTLAELAPGTTLRIVEPVQLVTVRAGDTLWRLAERHLSDAERWPELHELNRARVADPDVIQAGWVLRVPLLPVTAAAPMASAPERIAPPEPEAVAPPGDRDAAAATHQPAEAPEPPADLPAIASLVGGLTSLTAATVLGGLAARRRLQQATRPLGRRYLQPDDELTRVATALALRGSGPSDPVEPVVDRGALVGRAMRNLTAHWQAGGLAAPTLERAVVGAVDVEFVFVDDQPDAPDGFQHRGRRLAASWTRLARLEDPDCPVAYPALVTLGEDANHDLHLIDLVATGVLAVRGEGPVDEALSAMVVELACAPWASELGLLIVTGDPAFARAVASETVACTGSVDEGVALVEGLAQQRGRFLDAADAYDRSRLDPDLAEAWSPQVVLFETPPDAAAVARLTTAVAGVPCGLAVVLPSADAGLATWHLDSSDAVRGTWSGVGPTPRRAASETLLAQTVPGPTREALARLYDLAGGTTTRPAPWWASPDQSEESDVNIIALRPVPAPSGPLLRLLGPVTLEGAAGTEPSRASRQCLEYCAWLLDHPGATASRMAAALLVAEGTRRSNMSRLRSWLGTDAHGALYLPDAYSGRIHLHEAVRSDWIQLRELTIGGVNRASNERLVAALELVRGAPLADAAPGQWHWAEELRSDMAGLVRDVGVVLAGRARAERNLELARWAANRALVAAPDDELLLGERLRTEYAAGHLDEVDRIVTRLHRTARALGIDLLPETVDLLQEVVEGRLRARRA